nr:unnamed protein product [Spirometra erinaceieuropaei]
MALTSAAGFVALLEDSRADVKAFALKRLNDLADEFWAEISESVDKIEILYEDHSFPYKKLAALLASKVYYNLGEYDDALHFALCAEELFDPNARSEFVRTMITKCIDKYTAIRTVEQIDLNAKLSAKDLKFAGRKWSKGDGSTYFQLEVVVNRMFERCFAHKQYKQALGIAIETRREDIFEEAITRADDRDDMMRYALKVVLNLVDSVKFRKRLLNILVGIYSQKPSPADSVNICQCLVLMDNPQGTADILEALLLRSEEAAVTAYQIGFDLYENATQQFLHRVTIALSRSAKLGRLMDPVDTDAKNATAETKTEAQLTTSDEGSAAKTEVDSSSAAAAAPEADKTLSDSDKITKKRLELLNSILSGDKVIELHLQFLIRNNKADLRLLERIKEQVRNSVTHNATVIANSLMHCGTTSDQFLRDHLSWLGKAVNWAKFTATATLGVIHKGHEKEALRLMSAYLPKDASGSSGSVYTEGGGLFALGLIHANHGGTMTEYLLTQCKEAVAEPVRHGACLGLGLAAMGTGREDVYDQIKLNLYQDDAVTGEAAGLAMGLVMLGTGSSVAVEDLLGYAKETSHEKIIRGIALGIALVMYGRQEEADSLIANLSQDTDPILRWCGMATIAMAYCGTNSNVAVKRLLHAAVSDNNDDVRRWALTALGFVMFKDCEQVPSLVSLLAESYHPHLRYGAAMAVGIACAGTANKEAISLLDNLLDGTVHFVRQGALVAQAMILMQQNAVTCPKSVEFRERCLKIISDRHEDLVAKFGAILACGILDAGGCNMTISLQTRTGNANMAAAVGLLVFQNFWFWYPLTNFISLAFSPTCVIALNKELQMPKMNFKSNAKPSTFAYPPPLQIEKEKKKEKVETAVLSITAKHRKKELEKKKPQPAASAAPAADGAEKMDVDASDSSETTKVTKEEPKEPSFVLLANPARVMRAQQRVLTLPEDSRYYTIKPITQGGILLVHDRKPNEEEVLVEEVQPHGPTTGLSGKNAAGGTKASGSGGAAATAAEEEEEAGLPIHASTVGALMDDDEGDDDDASISDAEDDDVDEEDEEEADDEVDEDVDDDDDYGPAVADDDDFATTLSTMAAHSAAAGGKRGTGRSGAGGRKGTSEKAHEPGPPEPFLWTEDDDTGVNAEATTAGASATGTTNTTTTVTASSSTGQTTTTTATASASKPVEAAAKPEPMDTERSENNAESALSSHAPAAASSDVDEMIAEEEGKANSEKPDKKN